MTGTKDMSNAVLLQGCTLQDIEKMINRAVSECMKEFYETIKERPPVLIKRKEAAKRLGVSLPTLDAYAKAGFLQVKHLGGRVYFEESEIEQYKQHNKVK